MTTKIFNQTYPNLGNVKITFNDSTEITKTITTLGVTDYGSGSRVPVKVEGLGQTWMISLLPKPINYPNGTTGTMTYEPNGTDSDGKIYWNGLR